MSDRLSRHEGSHGQGGGRGRAARHASPRARRRTATRRRGLAAVTAVALALPVVVVSALPAEAAAWNISKVETSEGPYQPGETVTWVVTVGCSDPNEDPCEPTTMTDPMPEYVDLVSASIQSAGTGTVNPQIDADTDTDTVTYTADSVNNGQQSQILITGVISDDIPYGASGEPITNTATVESDNAPENSASDDIVPEVPLVLDSETTKSIDPDGAIANPGTPATVTIGGTNTSNDPVDSLVITEPTAGTDPNPFTYLGFTGWGDVTWPEGATSADVTFTCADGSTPTETSTDPDTLPDPPGDCDVQGFTVEFDGDIAIGAAASIPFDTEQTDAVTDLTDATTVTDTTSSNVVHGDDESDPTDASDTYVITPPNNAVTPTKSFDPAVVSAGDPSTVTIGATNDGDPTTELSITEPSPGTDSPFEGDDPLTFTGWGTVDDPGAVQWPNDATAASVTFTCADGSTPTVDAEAEDTLPDPPGGCDVVGFTVDFTGDIVTGAEASLPFQVDTDPDQEEDNVEHPNEITADIPNASGTADATLETLTDRLATDTTKSISPSTIPALPGQTVVVSLPTQLLPFGEDGSTTNADQIVVQDPTDTGDPGEFWGNFTASSVRSTDVPAGTELTINYWNGTEWVEAPGCGSPVQGAATVNCDLPDDAQGVQFVYDDTTGEGIPPGTSVDPNFVASYTGPEDRDDPIANCGASSASSDTVAPTDPAEGCDTVDPFPVPVGPGDLDFIEKDFLAPDGQSGTPYTLRARTQDPITAQITWSTNGFEGVDPMVISDEADPVAADDPAIAGSFYDAFNLTRVEAIDPSVDPLMVYDAITGVELFIDGAWVDASADPCSVAAPCNTSFPGYTLTADEQENATSVRLTYTESPTRAEFPTDPNVPAAGSGVARSTQADGRHLDLTFQLRDDRRSGGPALGEQQGEIYNNPDDPGLVTDTARGTATFQGTDRTDTDDDQVLILDEPINVGIDKEWTGGPLSVPPEGTPYEDFPSTIATITGSNNSVARVDELRIAEPSSANEEGTVEPETEEGTSPFDAFTLTDIIDVAPPDGAETTTVTLTTDDGTTTDYDEAGAEALTADDLADVVGVEVSFDGRIASTESGNNQGVLQMNLKLRELDRYTGERVTVDHEPNPVPNSAGAEVSDPGGTSDQTPQAWDTADMELRDAEISMEETKSFDPATIVEPGSDAEDNPSSTLTITGQPTGPSRAVEMTLQDIDGSFWNQYDLTGFDASTLTAPIDQVQVDAYTGGTYDEASDTFTGGTWTDGDPAGTFALPAGVAAADVVGLRFTFTRADGAIWENPANPTQEVNLEVQVRDTLRSDPGTPVPSDLSTNDAAPGEDAPGVATNDVTSTVTGADLVFNPDDPSTPIPVSGDADASGTINYQHAENGVRIVKDFATDISEGTKPPGAPFPMNITVTNVGNRPIYDPVIVDDPMPSDADGPQLQLADVDEPYSYALTEPGTAPPGQPNGPQMPTDPDDVTVDRDGNIAGLTWTFPEGTVLEVGQVYTITVQVEFRTTLAANTVVNNTAGVTGDRPWDVCQAQSGEDGSIIDGRLDEDTGACEADSDVTPIPSGVLQEEKFVKATDDDEIDVIKDPDEENPNPDETCSAPNAGGASGDDGYYAYPCTPVIIPGHNETWRIEVDNVGNLPLDKVVIYDRLPRPGDTAADPTNPSARDSQWTPILTNDPPPQVVNAPAGSTTTFYYSTVDDYCSDDLIDPVNDPSCPDDPETGWAELTPDTPESTYEQISAIKAVVEMADGNLFRPASSLALEGTTTTPPETPEAGDRSIAFNSAAASGVVVTQSGAEINSLRAEGTKVGVATASGPLEVSKLVTGDGADNAPDSFDLTVQCTSAVGTWVETDLDPIPITVTPGTPTIVPDLPYGAECTVTEDGSAGQTQMIAPTVTIDSEDPDNPTRLVVDNRYDLSSIVIDKEVVTDAVDQDGEPVTFGPFDGTVDCTFLGEEVYAEGYGPDDPMTFELNDGESVEFDGLPVGAECVVTETGTGNASSTTVTVKHGPLKPVVTPGVAAPLTLAGDVVGQPTNSVTLTNTYDVGAIALQKVVDGAGAGAYGGGPFTMHVVCTYDDDGDGPGDPRTVYESDVVLGGAGPLDAQISNLPTGAECTVTETDDAGATGAVVVPSTVTVGSGDVADVVITNTFDTGSIEVNKDLAGLGALYGPGPFEVELACTYQDVDLVIPGGATREIDGGGTVTYDGLPVGSECTLTETDDFGASSTTISVDGGDAVDGTSVDITVPPAADDQTPTTVVVDMTNTFDTAPLVVQKTVDGDGADFAPDMPDLPPPPTTVEDLPDYLAAVADAYRNLPYAVTLECTDNQGDPVETIPGGADRRFGPGFPAVYFGLQDGDSCSVTETDDGGATSSTIDPNPVTIDGDATLEDPVTTTVTNTFDTGSVEVDKVVDGDAADFVTAPFEVSLACTFEDDDITVPGGATRTVTPGSPATYDGLPVGAECVVTETDDAGATSSSVSTTVDGGDPGQVVVPGTDADPAVVTVTNTFDVGSIEVTKQVDGDGAGDFGTGTFTVHLDCTFQGQDIDIPGGADQEVEADDVATYDGLPIGAECTVTEPKTGGASSTVISSVEGGDPGEATVGPDPAEIVVTNTFDTGQVVVTKELDGSGASAHDGDTFTVTLACTWDVDGKETAVVVPGGATRTLSDGSDWTATYASVPQGASCTVAETDDGDAEQVAIQVGDGPSKELDPADGTPTSDAFEIPTGDAASVSLTVTNTFSGGGGGGGGGGGILPLTGSNILYAGLIAALLTGVGMLLLAIRRRGNRYEGGIDDLF
ncbi:DUF5979 domain-containing protein [Cellulomonas sp. PhB143]|uniref:DUF5979 domain-containing protein n=1 Tax=Cellulomonas sp. PhB143 TaxID=2485186 RepID=UPI000F460E74|nr:DUF5979 domain-containing protein [Cellulomonas sp. PhB143]